MVVEVGGWEHECCGAAIERNQLVDLECIRSTAPDGRGRLVMNHHGFELPTMDRVHGRVVDIEVVHDGRDPRTGEMVVAEGGTFLVTVRTDHQPSLG